MAHRLKRIPRLIGVFLLLAMLSVPQGASAGAYNLNVNGRVLSKAVPEMRNGQLMVWVSPMVEAMGGQVYWEPSVRRLTVTRQGRQVALWTGTHTAYQNGRRLWAPVAPYLNNGRVMVPAWWLAVRLGADVSFNGSTLYVNTSKLSPSDPLRRSHWYFPFPSGASYQDYVDTMGAPRSFEGDSHGHEGTDIMAPRGTPIVAVSAGTIVRYGWNTLGGYRVTIRLDEAPDYRFYYAHLDRYAPGLYQGKHVQAGELLGYVGNTGQGPERTEGRFPTHLHFGIYGPNGTVVNPYPYLRYWEGHKVNW